MFPFFVSKEEKERRYSICKSCEFYNKTRDMCKKCNCIMSFKTKFEKTNCPINKW